MSVELNILFNEEIRPALRNRKRLYLALKNIENDDGHIPEALWEETQAALKEYEDFNQYVNERRKQSSPVDHR
jgi:hypothetical protein